MKGMVLVGALALGLACRGPVAEPLSLRGSTMGTSWNVRFSEGVGEDEAERLTALIEMRLDAVDARMSTWRADSELSRFNELRSTEAVELSPELFGVVSEAVRVGRLTEGAFDPTVGPLVNALGFGPRAVPEEPPTEKELAEIRAYTGLDLLELDPAKRTARKLRPRLYLDLSGIAKGYAVDRVAEALQVEGLPGFMIEVGGEVRTRGTNAEGGAWRIGVERPDAARGVVERILPLSDLSMATSGDYRSFRVVDGRRLTHIVDPRTGHSVRHALASVTVLHASCATADALATALVVLGPEAALDLAEREGLAVLLLVRDGDGFEERTSTALTRYVPW